MHLGVSPYWALVCATLVAIARPHPRHAGRRYAPRPPADDQPTKPPAEDAQYACSAPDATPAQEPKFCLVYGHDAGYGSRFESFDAAREAWAARHNVTVLRNVFRPTSRYITYQKIEIVSRAIANPNCTHFMWQDSDLHVCRPDFSPSRWIANDPHLVLVDHAVSLNNGAFIMKRGPCMNAFVRNWHEWNSRRAFPFTDNGSMLAAILDFSSGTDAVSVPSSMATVVTCAASTRVLTPILGQKIRQRAVLAASNSSIRQMASTATPVQQKPDLS